MVIMVRMRMFHSVMFVILISIQTTIIKSDGESNVDDLSIAILITSSLFELYFEASDVSLFVINDDLVIDVNAHEDDDDDDELDPDPD
eukprot:CAMPEP_0201594370 /NCGR_PEP_ID=MMETSP0190_2-20130828/191703_1 /ASSEMBLY_ACC=CAM_ASM_000263 /TAXON_ID=37353 /ORGANISM="Rosalina sp." /LENGTH=87 /DNA_ID=CAMNT_0048053947 /DNA_START=615 /DNA_END=876 /DNA_ORIENTATION=-